MSIFRGLIVGFALIASACTNRVAIDLDPVVQFSVDEQIISRLDSMIEIPVELDRVANEQIQLTIEIKGIPVKGGGLGILPGNTSSRYILIIPDAILKKLPPEFKVVISRSTFSKIGERKVHTVKVSGG